MELFLNATSPYARLVRIVVLEKGLADAVKLRWCDPWSDDAQLLEANPAGRIPALITEDGTALSESLVIALYLDGMGRSEPIIPASRLSEVLRQAGKVCQTPQQGEADQVPRSRLQRQGSR
mgnify:CR=1 FL=1